MSRGRRVLAKTLRNKERGIHSSVTGFNIGGWGAGSKCSFLLLHNFWIDKLKEIVTNLQELSDQNISNILLYDSPHFTGIQNSITLTFAIKCIIDFKRFTSSLF